MIPNFLFLLVFGGMGTRKAKAAASIPTASVSRDVKWPLDVIPNLLFGACSECSDLVVLIVLNCCQHHQSKDEEVFPRPIG